MRNAGKVLSLTSPLSFVASVELGRPLPLFADAAGTVSTSGLSWAVCFSAPSVDGLASAHTVTAVAEARPAQPGQGCSAGAPAQAYIASRANPP